MAKLTYFLLILTAAYFATCSDQEECLKATNRDEQILRKEFSSFTSTFDDHVVAKFFSCLFKKNGVMKSDGSVLLTNFVEYVSLLVAKYRDVPLKDNVRETVRRVLDGDPSFLCSIALDDTADEHTVPDKRDLCDLQFDTNTEKNAIKLVNNIKVTFFAITFTDRDKQKDLMDVILA